MAEAFIDLRGLPDIEDRLEKIQRSFYARKLMVEIGNYAMTAIKKRTSEGKDFKGKLFKDYSPSYKLFRTKTGHPSKVVNLIYTGSMLASMTYKPESDQVEIYFMNTKDEKGVENPKKAFFNNERRKFFALSQNDVKVITNIINDYFRRAING